VSAIAHLGQVLPMRLRITSRLSSSERLRLSVGLSDQFLVTGSTTCVVEVSWLCCSLFYPHSLTTALQGTIKRCLFHLRHHRSSSPRIARAASDEPGLGAAWSPLYQSSRDSQPRSWTRGRSPCCIRSSARRGTVIVLILLRGSKVFFLFFLGGKCHQDNSYKTLKQTQLKSIKRHLESRHIRPF
jgi:hypothetical protein